MPIILIKNKYIKLSKQNLYFVAQKAYRFSI